MSPRPNYDSSKDFVHISQLESGPNVLVVNAASPYKSVRDLVAAAKARPGALNFDSAGSGSSTHMSGELFKMQAGIDITHIPYKGTGEALTDVMAGRGDMMFAPTVSAMPFVRQGKLRALAVTSPVRSDAMPDIPTVTECGVSGVEVENWYALLAPAATPRDRIERLWEICRDTLRRPEVARQFTDQGGRMVVTGPGESAAFTATEIDKWAKLVRSANIRA